MRVAHPLHDDRGVGHLRQDGRRNETTDLDLPNASPNHGRYPAQLALSRHHLLDHLQPVPRANLSHTNGSALLHTQISNSQRRISPRTESSLMERLMESNARIDPHSSIRQECPEATRAPPSG